MPQLIRYQFGNHLSSAMLELDAAAQIISYEEYYPYGSSSYQAVRSATETPKRYRYTGMERDEETGLSYHGARYYAVWLGKWVTCDKDLSEQIAALYRYGRDNPISWLDPTGNDDIGALAYMHDPKGEAERDARLETGGQYAGGSVMAVGKFGIGTFKLLTGLLGASSGRGDSFGDREWNKTVTRKRR